LLTDSWGRRIRDLRISVTDQCNFRCFYCKSPHGMKHVDHGELLTYEEIERLGRIFAGFGIDKIRITGGEPMLRKNLEVLIGKLSRIPGIEDLALTTNGFDLAQKAETLKAAGLDRVTVSLDTLQEERFFEITRFRGFEEILAGIETAREIGLNPVKINCVLIRNVNDDEIFDFVEFARKNRIAVRFIEFMPLDEDEQWSREKVLSGREVLERIRSRYELTEMKKTRLSETASTYRFSDSGGEIGLINTVSNPFCRACSRVRLTADGKLRNCLFSTFEFELRALLRNGTSDDGIRKRIGEIVNRKEEGHRINEPDFTAPPRTMSYVGG